MYGILISFAMSLIPAFFSYNVLQHIEHVGLARHSLASRIKHALWLNVFFFGPISFVAMEIQGDMIWRICL
ncbi:hypothetical protein F5890DRAFT_393671 [Lentinula detonsa]|uniref:Uncharacterized protein n=1 Tax=Lentinula detonsa TaxID=2804962 RepID=A0AA38UVP9_9AGAR|nr:hypothetical protein F5890DRAFT_393671 [Lentinula detonsa]